MKPCQGTHRLPGNFGVRHLAQFLPYFLVVELFYKKQEINAMMIKIILQCCEFIGSEVKRTKLKCVRLIFVEPNCAENVVIVAKR